eukprot:gnl/TRDRNA2_/TRDRNA2_35879_c0_seq1.p1 gnl/TRDRNA2_/TRDRNA2_35879_c0~~gnl/TRDRNA2_/TRDRNA2_35879_c0_seq1.p1  ORF type:complete len:628 (+),score=65.80 gnl/TRDRNA2_/TRDRNA2_35879_c0_seq1:56-1939(+)
MITSENATCSLLCIPVRRLPCLFALVLLLDLATADLPVHCMRHQIVGEWEFTLSDLSDDRKSCGHRRPDDEHAQPELSLVASHGPTTQIRITLSSPNAVTTPSGERGSWTMMYDEGFDVVIDGMSYFAFSRFDFADGPNGNKNVSHCHLTQVGWYHNMERTKWGCYTGRKVVADSSTPETYDYTRAVMSTTDQDQEQEQAHIEQIVPLAEQVQLNEQGDISVLSSLHPAKASLARSDIAGLLVLDGAPQPMLRSEKPDRFLAHSRSTMNFSGPVLPLAPDVAAPWSSLHARSYDTPMTMDQLRNISEHINSLKLSWTAAAYARFVGKTPRELNRFAGIKRHGVHKSGVTRPTRELSLLQTQRRGRRLRSGSRRQDRVDWRSMNGKNWIGPLVDQGDCGSCWAVATTAMMTARNRIRAQDAEAEPLSISFPLFCSEYNQGCHGGFAFLHSKWSAEVGLVPEHCAPLAGQRSCHVSPECDLGDTRLRAADYHYVGGYYGAADEAAIRRELTQDGPLVISIEPWEDFVHYKGGVYKSLGHMMHQEWEQVDHAMLLIGFGTSDEGDDFWTIQNSWGEDWGEMGFLRMARGYDESACESSPVTARVIEESTNHVLDRFIDGHRIPNADLAYE